jgi:hypothetical protein
MAKCTHRKFATSIAAKKHIRDVLNGFGHPVKCPDCGKWKVWV